MSYGVESPRHSMVRLTLRNRHQAHFPLLLCPRSFNLCRAEARGGLHIVEQSLWAAVPAYLRKLCAALQKHCGRPLPIGCVPVTFASWMGGDRDGNPTVTAKARTRPSLMDMPRHQGRVRSARG